MFKDKLFQINLIVLFCGHTTTENGQNVQNVFCAFSVVVNFKMSAFEKNSANSEMFEKLLFSQITLKDTFATSKIRDYGMIYLQNNNFAIVNSEFFARILFSRIVLK